MEKRLLIAFALSFAVLYGFRFIFPPAPAAKPAADKQVTPPTPPPAPAPTQPVAPGQGSIESQTEESTKIETELFQATVSNVGGVLSSFRLKHYSDSGGKPIELIDPYSGKKVGYPFAIQTADPALDTALARARFVLKTEGTRVSAEYSVNGVHASKTLEFSPDKYLVKISTALERNGVAVPHQVVWQGGFGDQSIPDAPAKKRALYHTAAKFTRLVMTGIKDTQEVSASMAGVEDQYFVAMFLGDAETPIKIQKSDYKLPNRPDGTEGAAAAAVHLAVPSAQPMQVYIGPKMEESLAKADPRLNGVIDYGWFLFAIIAKPLLVALRWLHGFIGNYGWSIIVLTFFINLVLFPLRIKQQLSMQKMQKLAPHLRQLQDKYKKLKAGDPKRAEVEQELMEINKQQLSGCLPMVLQMPLLFAFLNMMNAAIELRGAPWILWIKDLSQQDHLYILPISMGVAMFVQMKMSPTSPDPAQQKMMMITPVLVTILFLWFGSAAGLTLYWLTGNVISIAQQWFIRNYWSDDDSKPGRPRRQPAPA